MLENVEMGKRWEAVINEALGIVGVHINSALVSAQVRKRIYWTNIKLAQCDLFGLPQSAIPQPTECARLQTIPEWYKWEVSETQQYRMLGNGWTVEVIKHILSFLPDHLKK